MRQAFLVATAVAALVVIPTGGTARQTTICNGQLNVPGTYDRVVVPKGASCDIADLRRQTTINDIVIEKGAGAVTIDRMRVTHDIDDHGGAGLNIGLTNVGDDIEIEHA